MQEDVLNGETPFRRAYISSVIDQVEVDETEIRIKGRKSVLEKLVVAGGATSSEVPSLVREWRTRHDSNV
jgi:site-specific DNA recombinase